MRVFLLIFMIFLVPFNARAQTRSEKDIESVGTLAGVVLACGAYRQLYQFEEILSRYFSNTAPSQAAEDTSMRLYATAKANSYAFQRNRSKRDCSQTIADFQEWIFSNLNFIRTVRLKRPTASFYTRAARKSWPTAPKELIPRRGSANNYFFREY